MPIVILHCHRCLLGAYRNSRSVCLALASPTEHCMMPKQAFMKARSTNGNFKRPFSYQLGRLCEMFCNPGYFWALRDLSGLIELMGGKSFATTAGSGQSKTSIWRKRIWLWNPRNEIFKHLGESPSINHFHIPYTLPLQPFRYIISWSTRSFPKLSIRFPSLSGDGQW